MRLLRGSCCLSGLRSWRSASPRTLDDPRFAETRPFHDTMTRSVPAIGRQLPVRVGACILRSISVPFDDDRIAQRRELLRNDLQCLPHRLSHRRRRDRKEIVAIAAVCQLDAQTTFCLDDLDAIADCCEPGFLQSRLDATAGFVERFLFFDALIDQLHRRRLHLAR